MSDHLLDDSAVAVQPAVKTDSEAVISVFPSAPMEQPPSSAGASEAGSLQPLRFDSSAKLGTIPTDSSETPGKVEPPDEGHSGLLTHRPDPPISDSIIAAVAASDQAVHLSTAAPLETQPLAGGRAVSDASTVRTGAQTAMSGSSVEEHATVVAASTIALPALTPIHGAHSAAADGVKRPDLVPVERLSGAGAVSSMVTNAESIYSDATNASAQPPFANTRKRRSSREDRVKLQSMGSFLPECVKK